LRVKTRLRASRRALQFRPPSHSTARLASKAQPGSLSLGTAPVAPLDRVQQKMVQETPRPMVPERNGSGEGNGSGEQRASGELWGKATLKKGAFSSPEASPRASSGEIRGKLLWEKLRRSTLRAASPTPSPKSARNGSVENGSGEEIAEEGSGEGFSPLSRAGSGGSGTSFPGSSRLPAFALERRSSNRKLACHEA